MSEINIEEIMDQIRKEISEKGLDHELLRFEEVKNKDNSFLNISNAEPFDLMLFLGNANDMNCYYLFDVNREMDGGILSKLIKKTIRRIVRFYVQPLILDQMSFNTATVRTMNSVRNYILENEILKVKIQEMDERIVALENKSGVIKE